MQSLPLMTQTVPTRSRSEMVDITRLVRKAVPAGLVSGFVIVYVPHTRAGVTIQENANPDVQHDLLRKLETLVPKQEPYYQHGEAISEGESPPPHGGMSI